MGWSCAHCGDVNTSAVSTCEECGTKQGQGGGVRIEPQPMGSTVLWVSTLFGGVLAGYAVAIWNGRVLKKHGLGVTLLYAVLGIGGWLLTLWCLANLEPAHIISNPSPLWEPGFAIPVALAVSFLLVAIPYNRDTLSVNQWVWNHPGRKLVFSIGPKATGFRFTSFSGSAGELFGEAPEQTPWLTIPVLSIVVVVVSIVIGLLTLALANHFAPAAVHHHQFFT